MHRVPVASGLYGEQQHLHSLSISIHSPTGSTDVNCMSPTCSEYGNFFMIAFSFGAIVFANDSE